MDKLHLLHCTLWFWKGMKIKIFSFFCLQSKTFHRYSSERRKRFVLNCLCDAIILCTWTNDKVIGEFVRVRYFETTPFVDIVDQCCNCLCLRQATEYKFSDTFKSSIGVESNANVREWNGEVYFSSGRWVLSIVISKYFVFMVLTQIFQLSYWF